MVYGTLTDYRCVYYLCRQHACAIDMLKPTECSIPLCSCLYNTSHHLAVQLGRPLQSYWQLSPADASNWPGARQQTQTWCCKASSQALCRAAKRSCSAVCLYEHTACNCSDAAMQYKRTEYVFSCSFACRDKNCSIEPQRYYTIAFIACI